MKLYYENSNVSLYQGDMLEVLDTFEENSIDCIVTDPPYELNFMNKDWDNTGIVFNVEAWKKCLRVLKPGGYLLCFGASRIFHRVFCAIEDAGFEIRDTIMWLYGSGFPKGINIANAIEGKLTVGSANKKDQKLLAGEKGITSIGYNKENEFQGNRPSNYNGQETTIKPDITTEEAKKWIGWNVALKPAYEPIMVARKPFEGSLIDNVLKNGVGGFNIDECRVGTDYIEGGTAPDLRDVGRISKEVCGQDKLSFGQVENAKRIPYEGHTGRYPANVILTYDKTDKEEVCGGFPYTKSTGGSGEASKKNTFASYAGGWGKEKDCTHLGGLGDEGSASRYFKNCEYTDDDLEDARRYYYCPKASKKDRNEGCQDLEDTVNACSNQAIAELKRGNDTFSNETNSTFNKVYKGKNTHPTVKPSTLLRYLIRLVAPKNAIILDPFNGSGSTGKACMLENRERDVNYKYIGIDLSEEYLNISRARIEWAIGTDIANTFNNIPDSSSSIQDRPPVIKKTNLW